MPTKDTGNNNIALQAEIASWNSIKDDKDPALFHAYLERYPEGTFAPIAKSKLAALETAVAPSASPTTPSAPSPSYTRTVIDVPEQQFKVSGGQLIIY
jgi:hypothetical protein